MEQSLTGWSVVNSQARVSSTHFRLQLDTLYPAPQRSLASLWSEALHGAVPPALSQPALNGPETDFSLPGIGSPVSVTAMHVIAVCRVCDRTCMLNLYWSQLEVHGVVEDTSLCGVTSLV